MEACHLLLILQKVLPLLQGSIQRGANRKDRFEVSTTFIISSGSKDGFGVFPTSTTGSSSPNSFGVSASSEGGSRGEEKCTRRWGPKVAANEGESKEEDFEKRHKPALCATSEGAPTKAKAKKASEQEYGGEEVWSAVK